MAAGSARRLPRSAREWVESNRSRLGAADVALARRAATRVLAGSELGALHDDEDDPTGWYAGVRALIAALGGDGEAVPKASSRPALHQKKAALLTFLQIRGLTPTARQRARIQFCDDHAEVDHWLARVVEARSVDELLDEPAG